MLVAVNLALTWALIGLIWTIQVVHYPLFVQVGAEGFPGYHASHSARIAALVGVAMPAELVAAVALVTWPGDVAPGLAWAALAVLAPVHLSTVFFQVPAHRVLSHGLDGDACRRLVRTNWFRTAGWTARGLLLLAAAGSS